MKRLCAFALALAPALVGCGAEPTTLAGGPLPALMQDGNCFRARDVTNYNVKDENAAFVLTSRGYVYGLIGEECFKNNGDSITVLGSPRNTNALVCAGQRAEIAVGRWGSANYHCMAHVTQPIYDPEISGFRSRVAPPAGG